MTLPAFIETQGGVAQAAVSLGATRQTLYNWLRGAARPSPRFWPVLDEAGVEFTRYRTIRVPVTGGDA